MKFPPQIHLFLSLVMLANLGAPAVVRADPPQANLICGRINTPEALGSEKEAEKNRSRLFASWKDTLENTAAKQHRTGPQAAAAAPSVQAQNNFYYYLKTKVIEICKIQAEAEMGMRALSQKISETKALSDKAQMCGRFDQLNSAHTKVGNGMAVANQGMGTKMKDLKTFFVNQANENLKNLEQIPESGTNYLQTGPVVSRPMWQRFFYGNPLPRPTKTLSLRQEASIVWGENAKGPQNENFQPDPNSLFGGIVSRLQTDLKSSELFTERLKGHNAKIQELQKNCGTAAPNPIDLGAQTAAAEPDISGVRDHAQKDADLGGTPKASSDTTPVDPPSNGDGEVLPKADPYVDEHKIGDADLRAGAPPPVNPPPKVEKEGWISKNKGLLLTVGAGAAAVGGILWYKKHQEKQADKKARSLEEQARAIASASNSSTATSTSTSTSTETDSTFGGTPANVATPQGSKFVLSGIPSSATVGSPLSEITVAIINPSGILTQDSYTEVSVSCAEPTNCGLSGTLTVQAQAGKAKFTNLSFSSANQSVKLRFSSPGFEPVLSPPIGIADGEGGGSTRE